MDHIKKAAGYIRVSTAEQATKKLSIETQIAEIKEYANSHNMKLEDLYIDRGITARKNLDKRVDFMRMMHDVEEGKIDHIIVLRLDRFFRNVYDYHRMMNEYLIPNNCNWSAVKEQYTTTTTNGRLMINLRLAIAEQECDIDSDRIKDVLDNRAKQGFAITGSQPFGYKLENKRVVVDETKREIVKDFFDEFEKINAVRTTIRNINERHHVALTYANMRKLITNPIYCGQYRDNPNYCEGIISREQFDNVQRLLAMNVKEKENKYVYIFSGLLRCNNCDCKLVGNRSKNGSGTRHILYYRCNKAVLDKKCDNTSALNTRIIERYLVENVERHIKEYIAEVEAEEATSKGPKDNRKIIEAKMLRLNDLYVNGFIDMDKYKSDFAALQAQIVDNTEEKPKKDLTAVKKFLEANYFLSGLYETFSDTQKQAVWRSVIKGIWMQGKEIVRIKFL